MAQQTLLQRQFFSGQLQLSTPAIACRPREFAHSTISSLPPSTPALVAEIANDSLVFGEPLGAVPASEIMRQPYAEISQSRGDRRVPLLSVGRRDVAADH